MSLKNSVGHASTGAFEDTGLTKNYCCENAIFDNQMSKHN